MFGWLIHNKKLDTVPAIAACPTICYSPLFYELLTTVLKQRPYMPRLWRYALPGNVVWEYVLPPNLRKICSIRS